MSTAEAPDRIWAWEGDEQDGWENAYASTINLSPGQEEYVRATLAAEKDAEIERLTGELRRKEWLIRDMTLEIAINEAEIKSRVENELNIAEHLLSARARIAELEALLPTEGGMSQWYCEFHPNKLMGHDDCKGAGIPDINRLDYACQLLAEQERYHRDLNKQMLEQAAMFGIVPTTTEGGEAKAVETVVMKGLTDDTTGLRRFGHHPDSAIDFCIEVESLQARLFDAKGGLSKPGTEPETIRAVADDIAKAMCFVVGGDEGAVNAKHLLRVLDDEVRTALATQPVAPDALIRNATAFLQLNESGNCTPRVPNLAISLIKDLLSALTATRPAEVEGQP